MSIFDKDIQLPIEHLYDVCKDICNEVIPRNLMHYIGDEIIITGDIIKELKIRGIFQESMHRYSPSLLDEICHFQESMHSHNSPDKICRVQVCNMGYKHRIPLYRVWFYYNSSIDGTISLLTDFVVSIRGVININDSTLQLKDII